MQSLEAAHSSGEGKHASIKAGGVARCHPLCPLWFSFLILLFRDNEERPPAYASNHEGRCDFGDPSLSGCT
jgi:hypothetical protein